jgi:hypothetical protein
LLLISRGTEDSAATQELAVARVPLAPATAVDYFIADWCSGLAQEMLSGELLFQRRLLLRLPGFLKAQSDFIDALLEGGRSKPHDSPSNRR